ncbi:MAG: TonB-dependent receptor family protein [bacterium]
MKKLSTVTLSTAIAASVISLGAAASGTMNIDEEVIVSATRVEGPAMPVATSINIITRSDIEISGVSKLSELLRIQPGVQLRDTGGSGRNTTISTRGFSSNAANNTLVLVDGRKLNNASLAAPNLNSVLLDDIERVEIVNGSAGVLYGDQAVGGVINIITRRAAAGETSGDAGMSFGSDGLKTYRGSISQGFDSGFGYRASVMRKESDNYRDNNESDLESGLLNLRYQNETVHLFAEAQKIDDDLRLPGWLTETQFDDDPRQTNNPNDFSDRNTDLIRIGGQIALADNWLLLADYSDRDEESVASSGGFNFTQEIKQQSFSPRVQGTFDVKNGQAVLTLGYDRVRSEGSASYGSDAEQEIDAWYGQLVYPLTEKLTATVGGRVSEVDDSNIAFGTQTDDTVDAYEVGLSYQFSEQLRLFARYADAFRFANVDENGFTLPGAGFLKPQTSSAVELGMEFAASDYSLEITAYDMAIDNELFYDSVVYNYSYVCDFPTEGDTCDIFGANLNLPKSTRKGLSVSGDYQFSDRLMVKANYTYTDAEVDSGSFAGNEVPHVAKNVASLAVIFGLAEGLSLYVDANHTGSRYRFGDDANSAGRVGSDVIVNANLAWQSNSWEANLRVSNLTDEDYADYYGFGWPGEFLYPQAGTTAEATVSYKF